MKSLVDQLSQYATYHRDRRNITTHFVGIPMIVVGVDALLARPSLSLSLLGFSFPLSPALVATVAASIFYLLLERRFGLVMTALFASTLALGSIIAAQPLVSWLAVSLGLFVGGWAMQFWGHFYEGKKPAFADDLVGFLIGPLFVVAEVGFALGLRDELREAIESYAGPTRSGRAAELEAAKK